MENNFIGTFPYAASKEYCESIIERFEFVNETQSEGRGRIWTRDEFEGVPKVFKDDSTYQLGSDGEVTLGIDLPLMKNLTDIVWSCYDIYAKEYGVLSRLMHHKISPYVRVQKTEPGQGYHIWHTDNSSIFTSRRVIVVSLYLNTIKEGGETEFLYQGIRVPPVEGTLVLFPAGWTHPHRGNPPLKETKYIVTTWLEYVDG